MIPAGGECPLGRLGQALMQARPTQDAVAYSTNALNVPMSRISSMVRAREFNSSSVQTRKARHLRAADRDVESVPREQELRSARHVLARRRGHREEHHGRFATLELIDRAHLHVRKTRRTIEVSAQQANLIVVGGDHHEVLGGQILSSTVLVHPRRSDHLLDFGDDDRGLLLGLGRRASCRARSQRRPVPNCVDCWAHDAWLVRRPS